jgi:hypothetical protein
MPGTVADLVDHLHRLVGLAPDGGRLVVSRGPAWFVLTSEGGRHMHCEAAAKRYLPKGFPLTSAETHRLRQAGFGPQPHAHTLARGFELGTTDPAESVAATIDRLFTDVYRQPADAPLDLQLHAGPRDRTENPPVLEAMRAVSRTKDMAARHELYRTLLRAAWLVPMSGDAPRVVGDLAGWDSFAAFTDWAHLRLWDPRGVEYRIIKGRALFPMLLQHRVGSLLVNPGGHVGGELYRNEVESLAAAVR